eukprot:350332_1
MSANQYKLKVKVNNNDDTRLWRNASPNDFEGLCSFISTTWNNTNFIAQYEDDEGDLITIASIQDLKDAFDFAQEENKKSLKIFVQNTQKRSPQPQPQPSQPQIQSEPESEPQLEEKQEAKEFNSVHDMAFDFLSNKEIILLLPEMFGLLIDKLIKKGNDLSVDEIILLINTEIINNGQFNIIISHPLYVTYGVLAIPFIASKIAGQQSLYPHFNLQTIKTWITQVLQMFTQAIKQMNNGKCSFKDIVIDIQYPPVTDDGKVIHFGVECDLCGEYPIIGDRYKCSICEDWDCCPKCEPKHDHPLIKFKKSSKNHQNAAFKGLNEIVQRFSGINIGHSHNVVEKKEDINDNSIVGMVKQMRREIELLKKQRFNGKDIVDKNNIIKHWFYSVVGLPEYYQLFVENGIEEMKVIKMLSIKELEALGIKMGHRLKILSAIEDLKSKD